MNYLYVGNGHTADISAFRFDEGAGGLSAIGSFALPASIGPCFSTPLAVGVETRILFMGVRHRPWSVCSFAIDAASGHLSYLGCGPLADNPCYLSTDRTGQFLLSASYEGNTISVNAIGPDGVVHPPQQVIATQPKSHSILVDAANRHALSACLGGDRVYQWRFDGKSGHLAPNDPPFVSVTEHSGPRHLVFHPNGGYVYLLNELAATVCVFDYDPDAGTLREKQVINALPTFPGDRIWASDLHITPDGSVVYAAERGSSTLAILKTDPKDGTLSLMGHIATEKQPRAFAIDPTGRFLYSTGQLSGRMSCYAIDRDSGKLTKLDDYPVGGNPNWVEIVQCS